ncbi:DUF6124 family protein [Pseudomonas serboccidentalis]|uniref:DUF6124 family protein n=1 Tax=Pseudomonas serboccidentalis TaxID=2964670 RepID=UPI003CCE9229
MTIKPTPRPPEPDNTSPYESLDSRKLHDAAERALDHYLKPCALFQVAPGMDNESLLVHACESLASASIMLTVNRVLDNVEIAQSPAHS